MLVFEIIRNYNNGEKTSYGFYMMREIAERTIKELEEFGGEYLLLAHTVEDSAEYLSQNLK